MNTIKDIVEEVKKRREYVDMIEKFATEEVIIEDVDVVDTTDYPDFCDTYCTVAYWFESCEPLDDDELEYYNSEFRDDVYEYVLERLF